MSHTIATHRLARRAVPLRLSDMLAVFRQRRDLARLSDHLLDDIGVSRNAARQEANRLPWDAPAHWLR